MPRTPDERLLSLERAFSQLRRDVSLFEQDALATPDTCHARYTHEVTWLRSNEHRAQNAAFLRVYGDRLAPARTMRELLERHERLLRHLVTLTHQHPGLELSDALAGHLEAHKARERASMLVKPTHRNP